MASSSEFDSINDYNKYLINNNKTDVTIKDYIVNIKNMFYSDMDLSFMEFFMSLVDKKDICVSMQKLIDFKVISKKNASANLKDLLKQHDFKEGKDYRLLDIQEPVKQGGFTKKNEYILTPFAFKVCLIRSRNNYNIICYFFYFK